MPDTPALLWPPRLILGFVAAFVVLIFTGKILGIWFLLPAVIIGAVTTWRSSGRRLLQIGAELAGQSTPSLWTSAVPGNTELVSAINVLPGDWAYSYLRYQKIYKAAEREHRRLQELAGKRRAAPGQTDASQSEDDRPVMKVPVIPLEWVIATAESTDRKRLNLRFASGDVDDVRQNQQYYRRRPKNKPISKKTIEEASAALSELLGSLASASMSEIDLLKKLVRSYSDASAQRALRAGLSQRLIQQEVGFGRLIREICAVFSPGMEIRLRRSCTLSLSPAGEAWVRENNFPASDDASSMTAENKNDLGTINNFFIGDSTFYTVVSPRDAAASDNSPSQGPNTPAGCPISGSETAEDKGDSRDGLTVAWSAGVSATGAGLAALLLSGEAPWQRALFVSLIFVSGCAFLILIFAGLPNLIASYRSRHRKSPGQTPGSSERRTG